MSKKLYVGNLSWNTTDDGLQETFASFGEVVEAKVVRERDTGRSRGFGFVTFADDNAAEQAVDTMNGKDLDGRPLRVNEAHDKRQGGGMGGGRDRW